MTSKWGWVSQQLNGVDANKSVQEATVKLLKLLEETVEAYELTDDEQRLVLTYVSKLALAYSLVAEKDDERWVPVIPGEYNVRDTVRVKDDAYAGDHGRRHNGKRGRVAAVHQGKAVVIYDDAKNSEESFYHETFQLERLV